MMFAINLDERTKKVLLVLCALFIIILLIFGGIYLAISKYMEKESKKMDTYMYDLLTTKIVKNPKQFKEALFYHEERSLFNNAKWAWRSIILITSVGIGLTFICFNGDLKAFFSEAFKLFPNFSWPSVGKTNQALKESGSDVFLTGPSWFPAAPFPSIRTSRYIANGTIKWGVAYASMIYYLSMIICMFGILKAILGYIARMHRGIKMSTEVFSKTLDNFNMNNFNQGMYQQPVQQPMYQQPVQQQPVYQQQPMYQQPVQQQPMYQQPQMDGKKEPLVYSEDNINEN